MSDPYGGPFAAWDPAATYSAGDRVSFGGYIYEAMTAISANDNPRTATYTATLTDSALGGGTTTATLRKWRVWDYPASYYMARLRGLPDDAITPGFQKNGLPEEIRTVIVRTNYQNNGSADADLYDQPASASYSGYGMPAGMDSNYDDPDDPDELGKELVWSFSAARYEDGEPYAYDYNLGAATGLCYQPTTILASLVYYSPTNEYAVLPAWFTETQGQSISCYQTFTRTFRFTQPGPIGQNEGASDFSDNWTSQFAGLLYDGVTIATDPDYEDG